MFTTHYTARGELERLDQYKTLLNFPHTPPLTQQFAHYSEKIVSLLD